MRLTVFFVINFAALGVGSILMGENPSTNEWYQSLQKAPWTPPGWVFGAAWSFIMFCFSLFMWRVSGKYTFDELKRFYTLFALQLVLNVSWNPVFFHYHFTNTALFIIIVLTLLVGWLLWWGIKNAGLAGILVSPYFIWLLIATSLNAYVVLHN